MNYLLTTTAPSANENAATLRSTQGKITEAFIDASVALFWVRELKQYKELGFSRLEVFLESQGLEISKAQAHDMANLGSALRWINATREELVAVGYSSAKEIARLAKSKDGAEKYKGEIARLITRKSKGLMTFKQVRDEVEELLGKGKAQADTKPAPDTTPEVGDDNELESTATDWRTKYKQMLGRAADEADFLAMLAEHWGE